MGQPLPFAQGFYVSESLPISAQECVNLYPNLPQTQTVSPQSLFSTPGLTEIAAAGTNELNRGLHAFDGIPYAVNGENLYRIDRMVDNFGVITFDAVNVGSGIFGTERVVMADNGPLNAGGGAGQICIVIPESNTKFNAFIFTIADGLVQLETVNSDDFNGPVSGVVYVDGFFLFTKKDGKQFFVSSINDGFSYNALDFAAANVDPDPIRAPFVLKNEVIIFGSQTFEPFQNIGGSGFPFVRIDGAVQDKGISADNSITEIDGNMVWIGAADKEQAAIWISTGGKPQRISTTAIDNQIRTYSPETIENAFAMTYSQSGALFAVFTFPGQETFVYEATSNLWHTRESTNNEMQGQWRVSNIINAFDELIVGDLLTNKFGIIDKDVFTEYGEPIKRRFVLPPLDNGGNPFFNSSVELVGETGVGLTTGQGSDPQVLMSFSDNGGRSFGDTLSRGFGKKGEYEFRCLWDQLGRVARSRMYRFDMSDPVKWAFYKVEANFD